MDFLNPERVLVARDDGICYIQDLSKRHFSLAPISCYCVHLRQNKSLY